MTIEWWYWIIAGLVLILSELAVPAFFLIWFGLGALIVGVLTLVFPVLPPAGQMLIWAIASLVFVFLWFKVLRPNHLHSTAGTADDALGEVGLLLSSVAPFQRGRVRFQKPILGSDVWECTSEQEIAGGERVKVSKVEGRVLMVIKK